ncbi:hypothetical protein TBR22_A17750 [Luteitalea sp. TBR-22]|uniref:DUF1254 domain-containing protein n=1 Tax=Luteitalea sp. TBR-22 TaxID=2802971 RepID=UPI001AF4F9AF|nr:DUF1254 domain-containing protein [Luteitalea sp. TBR-22]BCS32561.1 hypothetical protein TBR22_A17750 [Luteitalea sp. TBR-22]
MSSHAHPITLILLLAVASSGLPGRAQRDGAAPAVGPAEARQLAKEAVLFGFPIVENYRIQYSYFVDTSSSDYKGPYNELVNIPRVYTPADRAIQTPNSDTPYSWVGLDLRTEPIVVTVPPIEEGRYWSLQLIDLYTHNFDYLGSRTTGNDGGSFAIAGPGWQGETPPGIERVIRSETALASAQFRTQLFAPDDLAKVKAIQARYTVQPLSAFLRRPSPPPAPPLTFTPPLRAGDRQSLQFFTVLNFLLQFCPPHPTEVALRGRLARIGVAAGRPFDVAALAPEMREALAAGMADAWQAFDTFKREQIDTGKKNAADAFGTREFLANNYMFRFSAAVLGIYGNSREEALYPAYWVDADGKPLAGTHRYQLRFGPGQLPPVHSFWSLTLYQLPESLLYANPLERYLINSAMLPGLARDPDGGITLYIQHESPGPGKESNWLPAPAGPFWTTLRLYWPRPEALSGAWTQPPLRRVD